MAIKQAEPPQAHETLTKNPAAVYLDVRTEDEFAQGHAAGAINIPVVFIKGPGAMEPNPDFVTVAEKSCPSPPAWSSDAWRAAALNAPAKCSKRPAMPT